MVEISDIVDRESLEAWLREQDDPNAASAIIAHRAAMRVLPIAWEWFENPKNRRGIGALVILRSALTSAVVCAGRTKLPMNVAARVFHSGWVIVTGDAQADYPVFNPYTSVSGAVENTENAAWAGRMREANLEDYDEYPSGEFWNAVRKDCVDLQNGLPLRGEKLLPTPVPFWAQLKSDLRARSKGSEATARGEPDLDWSFWIDWYERALAGTETRWEMLEEIALLEDEVWTVDPSALMDRINAIWGRHSTGATPNAETILRDPEDQKYYSEPVTTLEPDDIADALDRIKDAAENLRGVKAEGNYCIATMMSEHLERIDATVARYANRPLRLYELCVDITTSVESRIREGELTSSDRHLAEFLRELERSSLDILNDDEEVARKVRKRGSKRIAKLNDVEKDRVRRLTEQAVSESKPEFGQELAESADTVLDDNAGDDARSDAGYELSSRLTRMAKMKRDAVAASEDAGKVAKSGKAVWDLVTTVYAWFS